MPAIVLAIQDTTTLDFSGNRSAKNLDSLSEPHLKGFYAHNHALFDAQGVPLGMLDQYQWNRPPETIGTKGTKGPQRRRPIEEKESWRWVEQFDLLQDTFSEDSQTTFIDISDREGDIHELLQNRRYEHIHYIVRSRGDRSEHETRRAIREVLARQPVAHTYEVEVQNEKTQARRKAQVEVRFGSVVLKASYRPAGQIALQPTQVNVVWVREPQPPKGAKAVEWVLFTSLPVDCSEQALQVIEYYKLRWRIETFHYVLKQGCSIENLQIQEPQALQNAIATFSIIALQVFRLRCHMQATPQAPIEVAGFERQDYWLAATYLNAEGAHLDAEKPNPTVEDFARVVAQLGGCMLWKKKPPGVKSLWRGLADLHIIRHAYKAFNSS